MSISKAKDTLPEIFRQVSAGSRISRFRYLRNSFHPTIGSKPLDFTITDSLKAIGFSDRTTDIGEFGSAQIEAVSNPTNENCKESFPETGIENLPSDPVTTPVFEFFICTATPAWKI
jgi:hypothetical protein